MKQWVPMSGIPHPQDGSDAVQPVDQTLTRYRFVILGLVAFLGFSGGLSFFAIGPITPLIIDEYDINRSTASLLTSIVALVHLGFALPASMLIGRMGPKKLVVFGSLASSAPILSFLAVESFPFLLAIRTVYGLGFVILFPASAPILMQWFRPRELPLVNGVFVALASLGIATSTFIVAPLADAVGWEVALSAFGGVSLSAAIAWLALGRAEMAVRDFQTPSVVRRAWEILRSRTTLLVVVADAGPFALLTVSLAWLPTLYNQEHGMSLPKAGTLMGLLSLAGVVALVLASLLATRVRRRRPFLILPGILVGFAGLGTLLLADSVAVYAAVVALGFACWFYLPVLVTIPMEVHSNDPGRVAIVFATIMATGGTATFIAPLAVGAIADLMGSLVPGLALFAVLAWSLGIAGFLLPETGASASETKPEH